MKVFNKYSIEFDKDKVMKAFHEALENNKEKLSLTSRFCFEVDDDTYFTSFNGLNWTVPMKITKLLIEPNK